MGDEAKTHLGNNSRSFQHEKSSRLLVGNSCLLVARHNIRIIGKGVHLFEEF